MKMNITLNGEMREVNFTKPQSAIVERLLKGEKVTTINTHRRDGGDFVWYREDGYYWGRECVGYRAFWCAMYAIRDAFGLARHDPFYEQYFA